MSMWRMATTQSKYVGPNQNSICSVETPYYLAALIQSRGLKSGNNLRPNDHHKAMDAKRGALQRRYGTVGIMKRYTENLICTRMY